MLGVFIIIIIVIVIVIVIIIIIIIIIIRPIIIIIIIIIIIYYYYYANDWTQSLCSEYLYQAHLSRQFYSTVRNTGKTLLAGA